MNESISTRIRRIITGTAHSIVSKLEDLAPEMVLEQAIHEVDEALDEVRTELGKITAQKHHVSKAISRLNTEHQKIDGDIDVAFKAGRKDLLEAAFARQVDIEEQLPALENQLASLGAQGKELDQAITGMIAKRREMENELFEFKKSKVSLAHADVNEEGIIDPDSAVLKADKAGDAFSRVLRDATGVSPSLLRAANKESAQLVELAQLNRNAKIEAKMRELENRMEKE